MLRVTDERGSIRDLGSRNGTLVNGKRVVGEMKLDEGDLLQVGPLVFEVQIDEADTDLETQPPHLPEMEEETGKFAMDQTAHFSSGEVVIPFPVPVPAAKVRPNSKMPASS